MYEKYFKIIDPFNSPPLLSLASIMIQLYKEDVYQLRNEIYHR